VDAARRSVTSTPRIERLGTPRTLIWVWGEASGVFGAGEIVSLPPDDPASAPAGLPSARAAPINAAMRGTPARLAAVIPLNLLLPLQRSLLCIPSTRRPDSGRAKRRDPAEPSSAIR
jgi:hypothetical protein